MKEVSCGTCNMSDYYLLSPLPLRPKVGFLWPFFRALHKKETKLLLGLLLVGVLEGTFFCTSSYSSMLWVLSLSFVPLWPGKPLSK